MVYYQLGTVGFLYTMKNTITFFVTLLTLLLSSSSFSQIEQCGTMQNFEFQLKKDPTLKFKLDSIEQINARWIKNNKRGLKEHQLTFGNKANSNKSLNTFQNTNSLCSYDNTFFTSISAPETLNQIVSPIPNCTYGGEYVRVNNLVAGNTYRISTVGLNNFDTQITIYLAGGGNAVAYNDDWNNSVQSEIYFTPFVSGNYDVLIDQFGCLSNQQCASLQVELWYVPRPVITIPVVVHVIHKGEALGTGTNISVAQIQSQIDVLNQDFRRLNTDIFFSPAPFKGSSADPLIQFCLAQQKPDGTITDGIMRYSEPSQQDYINLGVPSEFQCLNRITIENIIKPVTIWDRDKYLNIWVSELKQLPPLINGQQTGEQGCNFDSTTLGYAQFPSLAPETDGVWVNYKYFGNTGNVISPFNLGRTATHEVGHWLNLRHTWGDENQCNADDLIIDTPLQAQASYGCNTFPSLDSCSSIFPGIMYMNYMDYSNDNCLSIFTFGQSARMDSTLFNQRASLLTSNGCVQGTLSNNDLENKNLIIIYPNPTISKAFFDNSDFNFEKVEIYNYLGQEVSQINFISTTNNQEVDMSTLATGIYMLKFVKGEISQFIKVLKN